jgi:hypothetical protein
MHNNVGHHPEVPYVDGRKRATEPAVWGDPPAGCAEQYVTRFGAREPGA